MDSRPRSRIGNLHCFLFKPDGEPRICIGPHWSFFLCLMSVIVLLAAFFVFVVGPNVSALATVLAVLSFGFLIVNYSLAALVNPGVQFSKYSNLRLSEEAAEEQHFCATCDLYTAKTTVHCEDCDVCIMGFDHHCPWTTKCVGSGNLLYFYGFLLGVLASFLYSMVAIGLQAHIKQAGS